MTEANSSMDVYRLPADSTSWFFSRSDTKRREKTRDRKTAVNMNYVRIGSVWFLLNRGLKVCKGD